MSTNEPIDAEIEDGQHLTRDPEGDLVETPSATHRPASDKLLALLLVVGGAVAVAASFQLVADTISVLKDPSFIPSCSINPVLSCGSVIDTPQGHVFGVPNPLWGLAATPALVVIGMAILAGATFKRWFWLGLQLGVTAALGFVGWLIHESLYVIGALCLYCMSVWVVTWPIFFYVTRRNLLNGVFGGFVARNRLVRAISNWHVLIVFAGYVVLAVLIGVRFWDYWQTLI